MALIALAFAPGGPPPEPALVERAFAILAPRMRSDAARLEVARDGVGALAGASVARDLRALQVHAGVDGLDVLFDGRLFETAALARVLGADAGAGDAALVARAYARWRDATWARLRGAYACVVIDATAQTLVLARDVTGQRPLFYRARGALVAVATEELAVLALCGETAQADEAAIAAHFALRAPPPGHSALAGVSEALPGEIVWIDASGEQRRAIAQGFAQRPLRLRDDDAYAEAWHDALAHAVRDELADSQRSALSLSGGLDSGALAALCGELPSAQRPLALSWTLPGQPDSDEREWIEAIAAAAGLRTELLPGDGLGPLEPDEWLVQPNAPAANAYRGLKQAQYARAHALGCDVLLSGNFGDHVHPDEGEWLAGAWRSRRGPVLLHETFARVRRGGLRSLWRDPGWRAPLRRVLGRGRPVPAWLTPAARALLAADAPMRARSTNPRLAASLLGLAAAHDAAGDTWFSDRFGLDVRYPYRHWRVLELALALPADVHWRDGVAKALTRRMLRGRLPEPVRLRPKSGSLLPLFRASVRERSRPRVEVLLFAPDARWPRWVERAALERAWRAPAPGEADDVLLWACLAHELWWRALERENAVLA